MLELKGKNLPKRQQALNKNVNEAISNKINFNDIRSVEEYSDVDRLFKIDIASKYRNSEYIIEQLKCGDALYISRALKCEWLYGDEFSHIINPDYLHHNIFPSMSVKMKKKMLTTISCHVRNEDRMLNFYKYCKEIKLKDIAFKYLIFTSELNKLEYLKSVDVISELNVQHFFGNSFNLVETYFKKLSEKQKFTNDKIVKFRYLYSVSNEKFLNLLESYSSHQNNVGQLGLRLSKNIMTKHKERVIRYPNLYIIYLNMDVIVKYSTVEEAKQFVTDLLPCTVNCFWSMNFYEDYSKLLNLLPFNEIYPFLKQIFMKTYGNQEFEMNRNFYYLKYYKLLTIEERESWALKHLEQKKELLGVGKDFLWYQFVNFDLAFKEIKKYIYKTIDKSKRGEIVNVLISSVRNEQQLETLIKYYYERHVNELEYIKQEFIDKVIELHNVFKFNESCWKAFNKILYSMKNFTAHYMNPNKGLAIIYYIIQNKEIPENLQINNIDNYEINQYFKIFFKYLTEEQVNIIYEHFINLFINKVKEFDDKEYDNEENKAKISNFINSTLNVLTSFDKTKHDCPDIIYKYIKLDWDSYKDSDLFAETKDEKHSEGSLIRLLKQDTTLLLKTLPDVINSFTSRWDFFRLNNLMKKLRIYFLNDTVKNFLELFETFLLKESLSNERYVAFAAINGIFHVANDDYKVNFMIKHAPTEPKISHDTIDRNILMIQESICRFAYYSRPPIPLPIILQFIKGDYLSYCLPMLNSYVANLPKDLSLQFITAILDAPVSVQKHGLRLAFHCFNTEDLKLLISNVWRKSKNISLRKILFISLFDYINSVDKNLQQGLYEVLKSFTADLHDDDDDEVFSHMARYLPKAFQGDFLETAWKTLENFSDENSKNIDRKIIIVQEIENHIQYVNKEFCRIRILDDFVDLSSFKENVERLFTHYRDTRLIYQKWSLAAKYITHFDNDKEMERSLEFASIVIQNCIEMSEEYYIKLRMYQFLITFLEKVLNSSNIFENKLRALPVLENIISLLLDAMPMTEIYSLYWKYTLTITLVKVIGPKKIDPVTEEESYECLNSNEIATKFTNELLNFINCLKEKNILYISFFNNIAIVLSSVIDTITNSINSLRGIASLIIDRLTDIQIPETFLLAVMLFFERYSNNCYNLKTMYDKVIKFDNEEVKTVMFQRYLSKSEIYL